MRVTYDGVIYNDKPVIDINRARVHYPNSANYSNPLANPAIIAALRKSLEGCVLERCPNALVTFRILDE